MTTNIEAIMEDMGKIHRPWALRFRKIKTREILEKYLQPTTKEKIVEISPYDLLWCNKCNNIPFKWDKYCSWCWAKIKRVD